jgi:hypothetical protein
MNNTVSNKKFNNAVRFYNAIIVQLIKDVTSIKRDMEGVSN